MDVVMYKDFVPVQNQAASLFSGPETDDLQEHLVKMNEWILENPKINVINIETVVLPNIHRFVEVR